MDQRKCTCGQVITPNDLIPERDYTLLGWILVTFGITAKAKSVVYHCANCSKIIEDGKEIMEHK